jgi:hypothetical protein
MIDMKQPQVVVVRQLGRDCDLWLRRGRTDRGSYLSRDVEHQEACG